VTDRAPTNAGVKSERSPWSTKAGDAAVPGKSRHPVAPLKNKPQLTASTRQKSS